MGPSLSGQTDRAILVIDEYLGIGHSAFVCYVSENVTIYILLNL
jgi:hypothetical protein